MAIVQSQPLIFCVSDRGNQPCLCQGRWLLPVWGCPVPALLLFSSQPKAVSGLAFSKPDLAEFEAKDSWFKTHFSQDFTFFVPLPCAVALLSPAFEVFAHLRGQSQGSPAQQLREDKSSFPFAGSQCLSCPAHLAELSSCCSR